MYECRECYEDTDISAGKIKQFCKTCNTQVSCCLFCVGLPQMARAVIKKSVGSISEIPCQGKLWQIGKAAWPCNEFVKQFCTESVVKE